MVERFLGLATLPAGLSADFLVDAYVFRDYAVPGKVRGHSIVPELLHQMGFFEQCQGFVDAFNQSRRGIFHELDAIGLCGVFPDVNHRVVQAARGPDDGNGAVPEAVHLVKSARFKPGRHQEKIAARFNAVREPLVKPDLYPHLGGITACQIPVRLLERFRQSLPADKLCNLRGRPSIQNLGKNRYSRQNRPEKCL